MVEIGKPFMRSLDARHFFWGVFIMLIAGIVRGLIHRRYAEPTTSWQPFDFWRFATCCAAIAVVVWLIATWLPWYARHRVDQRRIELGVVVSRTMTAEGERIEVKYPQPVWDDGHPSYGMTFTRGPFRVQGDEWLPFALLAFVITLLAPSIVMRVPKRRLLEKRGFEVVVKE